MHLTPEQLHTTNQPALARHDTDYDYLAARLSGNGTDVEALVKQLADFQVAVPSWALGAGGTRFGRFGFQGEPASLEQKIADVGVLHALTQTAGAISLHIPWDTPTDYAAVRDLAAVNGLAFDAMNSNTFQDQQGAEHSYRHGSLSSTDETVRQRAIRHNLEVIRIGEQLGSKSLTVWLADGTNFPGQRNFQHGLIQTEDSLKQIYAELPDDWRLFIE